MCTSIPSFSLASHGCAPPCDICVIETEEVARVRTFPARTYATLHLWRDFLKFRLVGRKPAGHVPPFCLMRKPPILVVDTSVEVRDLLSAALSRQYAVDVTGSFADAQNECRHPKHAALIVDVAVTNASAGVELIRTLRTGGDQRPVVATSGLHDAELPSRVYEADADAFVQKGLWTIREIRAVLARLLVRTTTAARIDRRVDGILLPAERFKFAGATIDPRNMTAAFPKGRIQHLNPKEIGILHVFAMRGGRLVRRTEILAHVWGPSAVPRSKTLDTYLVRLRRAYEAGGLDLARTLRAKPKVGWWVTEGPTS